MMASHNIKTVYRHTVGADQNYQEHFEILTLDKSPIKEQQILKCKSDSAHKGIISALHSMVYIYR